MKKNRQSLLAFLRSQPLWAASEECVYDLCWQLIHHADLEWTASFTRQGAEPVTTGPIRIIPVYGMLEQRSSAFDEFFGVTSLENVRTAFREAMRDSRVQAVVLDIDSPGGGVYGVPELAAEIRAARGGRVRVVAHANTLAASAAFWLGTQADELVVSPSGSVGSVGVVAVHQEFSRALEAEGITTTIISSGEFKTEGNPFEPLTDEAKEHLQERSDAFYNAFINDVAKGRRTSVESVRSTYGQGRVFLASQALQAGMVDRIESFDDTVARLQRTFSRGAVRSSASLIDFDAAAVARHETSTSDGAWDGPANETRLPSPMSVELARDAYAWIDESRVEDGEIVKDACSFIHHEIDADGKPGPANLNACASGRAICKGGRGMGPGTDWWEDRRGIWNHLAGHERDAGKEVPEFEGVAPFGDRLVALASEATDLVHHASERARLRAKEGRPAFSTRTEAALRASRDAIDALLTGEPEGNAVTVSQPGEPEGQAGPPTTPPASLPRISRDEFLARLARR